MMMTTRFFGAAIRRDLPSSGCNIIGIAQAVFQFCGKESLFLHLDCVKKGDAQGNTYKTRQCKNF